MCVTLSSSRTVKNPTKDVDEAFASCDLYLMDSIIPNLLLPNKKYRTIDPKLKSILGSSDTEAKLTTKFRYAYVEVLPLAGKKYIDDGITVPATRLANQKVGYVIEVKQSLLMTAPTSINTSAPLPIGNGVNKLYMDWLKDVLKSDPWPEYNNAITSPYAEPINRLKPYNITITASQIKNVAVSGSPSIPSNAKLIEVNDLMNNFKAGAKKADYKYYCLLTEISDKNIYNCFMYHIKQGNLPSQYFYVLGHGNPSVLTGPSARYNNDTISLKKLFNDIIKQGYTIDKTIVFLACHLGNGIGSFAELFSQLPGVGTVYAFSGFGWFGGTSPFWSGAGYTVTYETTDAAGKKITSKKMYSASKLKGHWRIFNTATAVIKS